MAWLRAFFSFCSLIISFSVPNLCQAADNITLNNSLADGQTLESSGQSYQLGFFTPPGSDYRYLGIWYKKFPKIVVWVANRESPIRDLNGVLTITNTGDVILHNGTTKGIVWSTGTTTAAESTVLLQLLDSGNLVLREIGNTNTESYTWQSFDYPTDTLLPGVKMGWNLTSGFNRHLTSWKDSSDPSPGEITYGIDAHGLPQAVLRKGSEKIYRTGGWNGIRFSGTTVLRDTVFKSIFVNNMDELYYKFESDENSIISRLTVNQSGMVQRFVLKEGDPDWTLMYTSPTDRCDDYGRCGANGICRISKRTTCECLEGFVPKSKTEWDVLNWSGGCIRRIPLDCKKGDGFLKVKNVKVPDLLDFQLNTSMNIKECEAECLKNCSCTAFTSSDIRGRGSGCILWYGDLIDTSEFQDDNEQDIYIRMSASELDGQRKNRLVLIMLISIIPGMLILSFLTCYALQISRHKKGSENKKGDRDLQLFDLATIRMATQNFSCRNMVGKGGFGPVYKGKLSTGQEIAVKRLSKSSGQGIQEFKNETVLIAKLQHRNLVQLLGCCLEGEERMLVYEFMPNKSLDHFIFDQNRRKLLSWGNRFEIAMGIAKGLLYLHQDSRLKVIHRDLKVSNILLDNELNPRISDFGLARIFREDQIKAKTTLVVGTYGYMSPEYAVDGEFSVKSDVFSYGVLLLEMVTGKKNTKFRHPDHHHSLLGHAWLFWNEGKALELVDECLEGKYVESQVLRCIQVSLLCFQRFPKDRPTMSSVVFMLCNEGLTLPRPNQPGFFIERGCFGAQTSSAEERCPSENEATMTTMEAR